MKSLTRNSLNMRNLYRKKKHTYKKAFQNKLGSENKKSGGENIKNSSKSLGMRTSRRFPTRYLSSKTLEQNNETKSQTTKTTDKTKLQNIFLMHETINFSRFGLFQFIVFSDFRKKAKIPLDFRLDSASRNSRALPKFMLNIKSTIPICFYTPQK